MVTEVGTEQMGLIVAEGAMLQLRFTVPVNPPEGVTVIVDVPLEPRVLMVIEALLLSAKLGEAAVQLPATAASTVSWSIPSRVAPPQVSPPLSLFHW
jgi:hypothetical protein